MRTRRRWLYLGLAVAAIGGAVAVWAARDADIDKPKAPRRVLRFSPLGLRVTVPDGWHQSDAQASQLRLYTDKVFPNEADCGERADHTTVVLTIDAFAQSPEARAALARMREPPVARPEHFSSATGQTEPPGDPCDATGQFITFPQGGRFISVTLVFGRDAPAERRAEAYGILDSLRPS